MSGGKKYKVFLVAGEPSGDFIGAKLLSALKKTNNTFSFSGVGGEKMVAEGLEEVIPFSDFSIMGIFENLTKTRKLYQNIQALKKHVLETKPDLVITIDFPGFNFRLGKELQDSGIPHMHYVGPTVWAWRPWRAKKIARFLKHLCVMFPFEPPYFEEHGLATTFVGHPLMEEKIHQGNGKAFRKRHKIKQDKQVLLFLPGSRPGELERHIPVFQEVARRLVDKGKDIHVVVPTLEGLVDHIPREGWAAPLCVVTDLKEKKDAYGASTLALAASGTIALELALARVPMVIGYRTNPLTAWLVRVLIKIPYVCMVNILLKRPIIPELLQRECTPEQLTRAVLNLLVSDRLKEKQQNAFDTVERMLMPKDKKPSEKAADVVLSLLK